MSQGQILLLACPPHHIDLINVVTSYLQAVFKCDVLPIR